MIGRFLTALALALAVTLGLFYLMHSLIELGKVELGDDEYLVLGDNTPSSLDGRYFGPIQKSSIVGKVVRVYWPFHRAGVPE